MDPAAVETVSTRLSAADSGFMHSFLAILAYWPQARHSFVWFLDLGLSISFEVLIKICNGDFMNFLLIQDF